jgi:two-component system chemotaxis response regulator CheY
MTIHALVVDDSQHMRRSMMYALERTGFIVCVEATDGADAIQKLRNRRVDIVLTDINMPIFDGLKLVAHLRGDAHHHQVPIIVITSEAAEEDKRRAFQLGATAYLSKPVQAQEVVETVHRLLKLNP